MKDSFQTCSPLVFKGRHYEIYRLNVLKGCCDLKRLPYSLKILLENLLRCEDGVNVTRDDILALANYDPRQPVDREIAFTPSRAVLQDFTGVPAVVDLAAMRDAISRLGGDPQRINPLVPVELVIDHSVIVDYFGSPQALEKNAELEFSRNQERYTFLRWGQQAFANFKVVPPRTGIVHQVNLEYLARLVCSEDKEGVLCAYPDTVVGTDSHTTMINGLGVLGWGVGGIEAEAAMLGQPITMLIPAVVGFRLTGKLAEGVTATDLVLTVTQLLRARGVVGCFVEFFGPGLANLPLADRATIANMAPEYGATCGIFPIDRETLAYLRLTGRSEEHIALVETYARAQGLFHDDNTPAASYSDVLELDLSEVAPSLAGPKRPQDRIDLREAKPAIQRHLHLFQAGREGRPARRQEIARLEDEGGTTAIGAEESRRNGSVLVNYHGETFALQDGAVVIAAITSCTNTSNPTVIMAAGLLARKAVTRGLKVKPWVKTSLAPGSRVVTEYLKQAGLLTALEQLGFNIVGYGCTTCIGNSGPLPEAISRAIHAGELAVAAVLSGNRNFEGRIHSELRMNFLASPPLVVAYALAGTLDIDWYTEPLGIDPQGKAVFLKDIWPSEHEIQLAVMGTLTQHLFLQSYADVFKGDERWAALPVPEGSRYQWRADSTYIQHPPYFVGLSREPERSQSIQEARVLAMLGDSITTDHISPAGSIKADSPAGCYLLEHGVSPGEFNSYGSRRGNHEVMLRGTFANIRLRNELAPGTEGGWTCHQPSGERMTIYDAAMRYQEEGVPLLVIAGREYGTGSSRDWAAKGTLLLGVRAVIAESYERIHRSNLVGMGVLPLQFRDGDSRKSLELTGKEIYAIEGLESGANRVTVVARAPAGRETRFQVQVRIDTPKEWEYYQHGGILQYVLRELMV
jgi:aconitate hydratase